jgi:urease accessory protein
MDDLAEIRLMQLISPALPIGAFTYSQGLEWAVEVGWINGEDSLKDWLTGQMEDGLAHLDLPILRRLYEACVAQDLEALAFWADYLLASRETRELRLEENQRGRALTRLLIDLGIDRAEEWRKVLQQCQAAGFALVCTVWNIPMRRALLGYAWGWLENQVAAAIKLIPLGQTSGQRVQLELSTGLPDIVDLGLALADSAIGSSAPALAIASSYHETQYTRLFRS